jgi:hypothetical protein
MGSTCALESKCSTPQQLPSTPPPRIAQTTQDKHLQSLDRRNRISDVLPLVDLKFRAPLPQRLARGRVLEIRERGADDGVVESCSCEDDVRALDGGFERGDVVDVARDDLDAFCNQCLTRWFAGVTRCAADFLGGVFKGG